MNRRRVAILALMLVLGAAVNLLMAWSCTICCTRFVAWWRAPMGLFPIDDQAVAWSNRTFPADLVASPARPHSSGWAEKFGVTVTFVYREPKWTAGIRLEAGWPLRALEWSEWQQLDSGSDPNNRQWTIQTNDAVSIDPARYGFATRENRLPTRIVWGGFVANTAMYAIALALTLAAIAAIRRELRRRRGLCVRCGYDLRGGKHEVCPECGTMLRLPQNGAGHG